MAKQNKQTNKQKKNTENLKISKKTLKNWYEEIFHTETSALDCA